jgi:hypothetical protein
MRAFLASLTDFIKQHKQTLILLAVLVVVSVTYSTHLSLKYVPRGYDLLFHLGNVFALQITFGFSHNTLASLGISPLIFHDYGYGTHLFYPPLAHYIPALISYVMTVVGINSTLLAVRLFSFLTIFFSGVTMYYAAKKITNHTVAASFATLLYLSAPYMQMDYYWRGGMSSSLCFVFLPILLLSLYYFTKEKYAAFFFSFVASISLIVWTHMLTAIFSFILVMIAIAINFFFVKNKKGAFVSTFVAGLMIAVVTSPFWSLLLQQQLLQTHVIYSPDYPFTIETVTNNTIKFIQLFDIQFKVWEFMIRNLFALINLVNLSFFLVFVACLPRIHKTLKSHKFLYTLIGLFALLLIMTTTKLVWPYLPHFFAYIQYPHRLLLQTTPVLSLLIALPFVLIKKVTKKVVALLSVLALFIVSYTYVFNNYALYELGTIDYTTHSIIQAMGVEREYLPIKTREQFEPLETRPYSVLAITNNVTATPSATIVTNETPYMLAKIEYNNSKETVFELPRLFYAGYQLSWQPEGSNTKTVVPYTQSKNGLITANLVGNGMLEVQYTGGKWYPLVWMAAAAATSYFGVLAYYYVTAKKKIWLEKV